MPRSSRIVKKPGRLSGESEVPGDKSISHRCAILGALANGTSRITNYSSAEDCLRTLECLRKLGIRITTSGDGSVEIEGRGLRGLQQPAETLYVGNSGTTLRLLTGVLAGQPFDSRITGDASLVRRDMLRIINPLRAMGARIEGTPENTAPLSIYGRPLKSVCFEMPIPSAQVKSGIILAGLYADGVTTILEPVRTRDHTENLLLGLTISERNGIREIEIPGGLSIAPLDFEVPGDLSGAAFLLSAACLLPGSDLTIKKVTLNPTRTAFLETLLEMGAKLEIRARSKRLNEPSGDIRVTGGVVRGISLSGAGIAGLIDELPVLCVIGSQTPEGIEIRDARELRMKESDRIEAIARNFRAMGIQPDVFEDGIRIPGNCRLKGGTIKSFGDHRIAMAFAVAGQVAEGTTVVEDADCVTTSFPGFWNVFGTD